jgi:hypothetical protein
MAPEAPLSKWGDKKGVDIANGGVRSPPKPKRSNELSIKFMVFALLALGMYLWRRLSVTPIMVNYALDEGKMVMDFDDVRTRFPILVQFLGCEIFLTILPG